MKTTLLCLTACFAATILTFSQTETPNTSAPEILWEIEPLTIPAENVEITYKDGTKITATILRRDPYMFYIEKSDGTKTLESRNNITNETAVKIWGKKRLMPRRPGQPLSQKTVIWPMFQRLEVVTLTDKDIPAEYKRTKVTDTKGRSIEGEWLVIDRKSKFVKFRRKDNGKEYDLPFDTLCEPDRRYAELETGIAWDTGNPGAKFDPKEPLIDTQGRRQRNNYVTALEELMFSFSPEEILDHIRLKTLTTSFIYEYDKEWKGNYVRGTRYEKKHNEARTRTLTDIANMLNYEPPIEKVSLKAKIDELGLRLYEETAPRIPPDRENDTREYGLPGDALCQANHFVAQYIGLTTGKPKVSYLDFIKATTPTGYGKHEGRPMWTYYDHNDGPKLAVENAHKAKIWNQPEMPYQVENIGILLSHKLIRQHIRNNKPVVVHLVMPSEHVETPPGSKEGFAILIGFTTEQGQTTYEAFMIYGPTYLGSKVYPPITTEYKNKLGQEYINLRPINKYSVLSFIE